MFKLIQEYCLAVGVLLVLLAIFALGGVLLAAATLMFILVVLYWFIADLIERAFRGISRLFSPNGERRKEVERTDD